jgi:hypothetical protein
MFRMSELLQVDAEMKESTKLQEGLKKFDK